MDPNALYREEIYTDRRVGVIRRMTPVKSDGTTDGARRTLYVGEAQIMTAAGALPLTFELPAQTLDEAVKKFSEAAKLAVEQAVKELQDLRRQAASSIVIPQAGAPIGPGGGKIKLP